MTSGCEISIEFDRSDRQYRGGETITGFVHLVAHRALTYDSITLVCFWGCHGYGLPVTRPVDGARLDGIASLSSGERRSFPFSFEAPAEPLSYRGVELNIDQYVSVEVDVQNGKTQKKSEAYQLLPGLVPSTLSGGPGRVDSDTGTKQSWAVSLVLLLVGGASFLIAPIFGYLVFGVLVLLWVHTIWFKGQLHSVLVTTSNTVLGVGGDYALTVICTPRMSLTLDGIQVKLRCLERSTDHPHNMEEDMRIGPVSISQEIYNNVNVYREGATLKAGERFITEIRGTVPETMAYSFSTGHGDVWEEKACSVHWELQVSISTRLFASWTGSVPIQVVPPEFLNRVPSES